MGMILNPYVLGSGASPLLAKYIGYWKKNEASENRADSIGSFTLTDNNTVGSDTGKVNALAANYVGASSESLSVASAAALQGGGRDFFFDLWFYPTSVTGVQFLFAKGTASSGAGHEYSLFLNGQSLSWRVSAGSNVITLLVVASPGIVLNTWYYVAMWYELATTKLWGQLNNNAATSSAVLTGTPNTTSAVLSFGAFNAASSFYTGRMCEVGRSNTLLTGSEILARYNGGAGNTHPFP